MDNRSQKHIISKFWASKLDQNVLTLRMISRKQDTKGISKEGDNKKPMSILDKIKSII